MRDLHRALLYPIVTEKALAQRANHNQYVFEVAAGLNKIEIARAVEKLFKVKVTGVRVMTAPAKARRMGMFRGERSSWKKALVSLRKGDRIEMVEGT